MRKIKYNFLYVIGLMFLLGAANVFANNPDDVKRPKNTGILTIKTSPESYPVKVDGQVIGMSGVNTAAEFYLAPGNHRVEVEFPNGQVFSKDITTIKNVKECVCLTFREWTETRKCPYDVRVDAPSEVVEGDLITFASFNAVSNVPTPLTYKWRVTPDTVRITSGLGTPVITVDSTGMGGQTIRAELDVTDDVYGATCMQRNAVPTFVKTIPPPEQPKPFACDMFEAVTPDDDKARFDNCVIMLQNTPDALLYIIIYQGTDKRSTTVNTYDKLSKRTLDYLVKNRGVPPRSISIVRGGDRAKTTYEMWIVPPGAALPVPQ